VRDHDRSDYVQGQEQKGGPVPTLAADTDPRDGHLSVTIGRDDSTGESPANLQLWPALDAATEAALRASIERWGVLVPVAKDQHGRIIDGHHRARIAREVGRPCSVIVHWVADDDEAREMP